MGKKLPVLPSSEPAVGRSPCLSEASGDRRLAQAMAAAAFVGEAGGSGAGVLESPPHRNPGRTLLSRVE